MSKEHVFSGESQAQPNIGERIPYPFKLSTRRGPFTTHNGPWYHWAGYSDAFIKKVQELGPKANDLGETDREEEGVIYWQGTEDALLDVASAAEACAAAGQESEFRQAVRLQERHCNSRGHAHGGFLSAFADGLLATAIFRATGRPSVTVRLTTDFLRVARVGEWMQGTARIERATRSLAFVEARAWISESLTEVPDQQIFTSQAIFKFTDQ